MPHIRLFMSIWAREITDAVLCYLFKEREQSSYSLKKNLIIDNDIIFIPNSSVQVGYVSYSTPLIKYNKQYASFFNEKC